MIKIQKYQNEIGLLKPLTTGYLYNYDAWATKFSYEQLECISEYVGKNVTRRSIINEYKKFYKFPNSSLDRPFLLTMIWGYANTGYGPFRTYKYFSNKANKILIEESLEAVRDNKICTAFSILSQIKGLGISYISKVLYFAGRARGITNYPLIFDIRVARSLVSLSSNGVFDSILKVTPVDSPESYSTYNNMLHEWAKRIDVEAEQIEYFLFLHNPGSLNS